MNLAGQILIERYMYYHFCDRVKLHTAKHKHNKVPSPGVVLPPGVALGVACPGVTWLGVDSHILVLGVAPGVSEPGL